MTWLTHGRTSHRSDAEDGLTLIELSITMLLLGLVLAMLLQSMVSVQNAVDREAGRNTRNDRLQLAVFAIERQVRSGNVIGDPASANDPAHGIAPGMAVRVYTQAQTSVGGTGSRCVEWRIYNGRLESWSWSPTWAVDGIVSGWQVHADGIRNREVAPTVAAFVRPTAYAERLLRITFVADGQGASGGGHEGNAQRLTTSITGRNTGAGYPDNKCDLNPPYPT
jgi:prepilin-type N-terminal cleavage/methylation domain-containing protein